MRTLAGTFLVLLTLATAACETASYKQTKVLAGTNWVAADASTDPKVHMSELQFGKDLSPSGMGQVRIDPNHIVYFQVIDAKLVMRADLLTGHNHEFNFKLDGDELTLTALDQDGKALGDQHFTRAK